MAKILRVLCIIAGLTAYYIVIWPAVFRYFTYFRPPTYINILLAMLFLEAAISLLVGIFSLFVYFFKELIPKYWEMVRKILGILNIVAGVNMLALLTWLWFQGNIRMESIIYLAPLLLVMGTSFASGIFVLKGRHEILAAINLTFTGFVLFILFIMSLFALFD